MDKNLAAFLDENAYTVKVKFPTGQGKSYTYVTNIPGLMVGQLVLVPALTTAAVADFSHLEDDDDLPEVGVDFRIGVATVVEVHSSVEIQPNADTKYGWVAGLVDLGPYYDLLQRNKEITKVAHAAYQVNIRRSFAQQILAGMDPDSQARLSNLIGSNKNINHGV